MQTLVVLICLFGAAASQKTYYCNSPGITAIRDRDFYLITRRQGSSAGYPPGMKCSFTAVTNAASQFFVEISQFQFSNAYLTIKSDGTTLLSGSSVHQEFSTLLTRNGSLTVQFDTYASGSHNETGVTLRVRAVQKTDCPPGWYRLNGTCFGTSATSGMQSYTSAQFVCNRMLSNLLHIPYNIPSGIWDLLRQLPPQLLSAGSPAWIGLTDIQKRFNYVWLSGDRFYQCLPTRINSLSCSSGQTTCSTDERCAATVYNASRSAIYMTNCRSQRGYICSMLPGGDRNFYGVPTEGDTRTPRPIAQGNAVNGWYIVLGLGAFWIVGGCCVLCCCGGKNKKVQPASPPPRPASPVEQYEIIAVRRVIR